jgi:hypothetical protein
MLTRIALVAAAVALFGGAVTGGYQANQVDAPEQLNFAAPSVYPVPGDETRAVFRDGSDNGQEVSVTTDLPSLLVQASYRVKAKRSDKECPRGSETSGCPKGFYCTEPGGPFPPCKCLQCTRCLGSPFCW